MNKYSPNIILLNYGIYLNFSENNNSEKIIIHFIRL